MAEINKVCPLLLVAAGSRQYLLDWYFQLSD
jgi:hypothetical protein